MVYRMRISTSFLAFAALLTAPLITIAPSGAAGLDKSSEDAELHVLARRTYFKDIIWSRLQMMQGQQCCTDAAVSADELKACRWGIKKARQSLRQDYQAYMNNVRN